MPVSKHRARALATVSLNDLPAPWLDALVQDYLTAPELLSLFQVNRGMAATVLEHASKVQLRLTLSNRHIAQQRAQRYAIEAILALSPEAGLNVVLHGTFPGVNIVPLWGGRIRKQVRHLTLMNTTVTADMLQSQLQLQRCKQLHTLVVAEDLLCASTWPPEQCEQLAQQRACILPGSLTRLHACSEALSLIHLAGPQLKHLPYDGRYLSSFKSQLSQLTHIRIHTLYDSTLGCLMELPNFTHITLTVNCVIQDHSGKQPRWQQLEFLDGANAHPLQLLPLHCIQQLVIHKSMSAWCLNAEQKLGAQKLAARLANVPKLVCVPKEQVISRRVAFQVLGQPPAELVTLCVNSMSAIGGGLGLLHVEFPVLQQLLPCILNVLPQVQVLHIHTSSIDYRDGVYVQLSEEERVQILQQLVGALPQHVKELVLVHDQGNIHMYASAVLGQLQAN